MLRGTPKQKEICPACVSARLLPVLENIWGLFSRLRQVDATIPDLVSSVLCSLVFFFIYQFLTPGWSLYFLNYFSFKPYPSLCSLPIFFHNSLPGGPHFRWIRLWWPRPKVGHGGMKRTFPHIGYNIAGHYSVLKIPKFKRISEMKCD